MEYKAKKVDGKKIDEHRLIFERHLGRKLKEGEVVHHIDGNKANNCLANLMLFPTKSAHTKYHYEKGDLKLIAGDNRNTLISGKISCIECHKLKVRQELVTDKTSYLGVRAICRNCDNKRRDKK